MKRIIIFLIFSMTLLGSTVENNNAYKYQEKLGVGIDVDWVKTKEGRKYAQLSYENGINVPKIYKERGFSHVRIRIKDDLDDISSETNKSVLEELKLLVNQSLGVGLIPIIAYQGNDFKEKPNEKEMKRILKWWEIVSKEFRNSSNLIAYDLIIETNENLKENNDKLNEFYQKAIERIREIDNNKIIIIAPNNTSNPLYLSKLELPKDKKNIMVEWHFYAAGPNKRNSKKKWTVGTLEEKKLVLEKVKVAYKWSKENQIPTWVGAWAVNNYNTDSPTNSKLHGDNAPFGGDYTLDEQKKFASFMTSVLKDHRIPYAIISDTKFYNRKTNEWYKSQEDLLDIILLKEENI